MPVLRYITWVGVTLMAVFFLTDTYLPKAAARIEKPQAYKIAIASRQQGPQALTFSGDNRVFPQQVIAEVTPKDDTNKTETPAAVRDAFAKLNDNPPAAASPVAETPAQSAKKTVKRKVRKPATDYAREPQRYPQNVAYHRPFEAPFQRSLFW